MRVSMILCVLIVGTGASSASAQYNWWDSDETRALKDINRSLEAMEWQMFKQRLDSEPSLGGYAPLYPSYKPSKKQIREWNKKYYRALRAQAKHYGVHR